MNAELFSKELNPVQLEAVNTLSGPLLILAGAGSGKTRVLTYRLANLILQGFATPSQILMVTFTNKAARGMEARSVQLLNKMGVRLYERLWISTFHSTCVRILRSQVHNLGYQPFFAIYDQSDQLSVIKRVVDNLGLNEKIYPPKTFQGFINDAKMRAITVHDMGKKSLNFTEQKGFEVYEAYEKEMRKANAMDFGDLLLKVLILFREHPSVLEHYQNTFKYVMVDEYQDTNHIQYLLVHMLAKTHQNLCVVGDEDQSIYSWRGADITNILTFEKDFANSKIVKLEQNYRSTKTIVTAASHLIRNNTQRKDKTLFTENVSGDKIIVREEPNEYEEARFVARSIVKLQDEAVHGHKDFAIFYRTNAQSRVLEEQLRMNSIPYRIVGGVKFYDRMEIKDILGYLRLILNPSDDVSVLRVINTPVRGIGKTTMEKLQDYSYRHNLNLLSSIPEAITADVVNSATARKLRGFHTLIEEMRATAKDFSPSQAFHEVLDKTGYVRHLREQDSTEAEARIDNLEELDNAMVQFEKERGEEATLQAFLEEVALVADVDNMKDDEAAVTLMTLHISKGLEFPYVFIVGLEEGMFPSGRSFESEDENAIEEERRLAYVGMTRAEKKLHLSYARTRKVWGVDQSNAPSRFLSEIPDEFVENSTSLHQSQFVQRFQQRFGGQEPDAGYSYKQSLAGPKTDPWKEDVQSFPEEPAFDSASGVRPNADFTIASRGFTQGQRVRHPTFGVGTVYQMEGKGDEQKVSILFHDNVLKKFVVKYARLERL